jgi:hypothetical protein
MPSWVSHLGEGLPRRCGAGTHAMPYNVPPRLREDAASGGFASGWQLQPSLNKSNILPGFSVCILMGGLA